MKWEKLLLGVLIAMVFVFPVAFAVENDSIISNESNDVLIPEDTNLSEEEVIEDLEDPGITPDNPLYGLDRAMERLDLALTFNRAEKAKKGLIHARERLAEVKSMIEAKKLAEAEVAQEAHDEEIAEVEAEIGELSEESEAFWGMTASLRMGGETVPPIPPFPSFSSLSSLVSFIASYNLGDFFS